MYTMVSDTPFLQQCGVEDLKVGGGETSWLLLLLTMWHVQYIFPSNYELQFSQKNANKIFFQ